MFVYNVKVNSKKLFKVIFGLMIALRNYNMLYHSI